MVDPIELGKSLHRRITLVAGLIAAAYQFPDPASAASPPPPCPLTFFAEARAQGAVDGRTILLADGREVRLAGIEIPATEEARTMGAGDAQALHALVAGKDIVLKHLKPATDRYGRLVAWGFRRTPVGEESLAALLLAKGHARVAIPSGERACMGTLLAAERVARAGKLGLWGDPRYELKRAQNPGEIAAARGRFSLVEGPVLSVRESGGVIYVNFGRRWTEDFTVTISKRNERLFTAAGLVPKVLQGRRVSIRGVVEERGGPWIEATRPEQIEILDGN
ncbi:thermonuclease family protein [Xanthobacteraceae bacterium Astr-EGSB]|uniref:thermonuclease family protein n=1 Tax=Astrobacterium formosum TaxID=3069710 RepID=UPI0027B411F9|nr:thermonuclease family protein [Xanthobacteraceae bacterium Astr-EGSB]